MIAMAGHLYSDALLRLGVPPRLAVLPCSDVLPGSVSLLCLAVSWDGVHSSAAATVD